MGSLSDWAENAVLDTIFGKSSTAFSTGAGQGTPTIWFGLWRSTAAFNETFTATSTGECAGSTYARVSVTNSSTVWTNAASASKSFKTAGGKNFTASAGSDWGTVSRLVLLNSNSTTTGKIITWTTFAAQTISAGNTVTVTTGLTISAS